MTDFTHPTCQLLSRQSNCSDNCSSSTWQLSIRVTDGADGTGVEYVRLKQGNGTLNTSLAAGNENITLASYSASCCSPDMELMVVDRVGNIGSCFYSQREGSADAFSASNTLIQSPLLCLSILCLLVCVLTELGIN